MARTTSNILIDSEKDNVLFVFYECLRQFGLEWFGSRSFFDQRKDTGQSLWMDLALARRSGQELRNSYTIIGSPEFAPLRKFVKAAIHQLHLLYTGVPDTLRPRSPMLSLCDQIRTKIDTHSTTSDSSHIDDTPVVETTAPSMLNSPATSSTVDALVRPLTPANKSLRFLESGAVGPPHINTVSSRAVVSGMSVASMDLLSYLDPLPIHDAQSVRTWRWLIMTSMLRDRTWQISLDTWIYQLKCKMIFAPIFRTADLHSPVHRACRVYAVTTS